MESDHGALVRMRAGYEKTLPAADLLAFVRLIWPMFAYVCPRPRLLLAHSVPSAERLGEGQGRAGSCLSHPGKGSPKWGKPAFKHVACVALGSLFGSNHVWRKPAKSSNLVDISG